MREFAPTFPLVPEGAIRRRVYPHETVVQADIMAPAEGRNNIISYVGFKPNETLLGLTGDAPISFRTRILQGVQLVSPSSQNPLTEAVRVITETSPMLADTPLSLAYVKDNRLYLHTAHDLTAIVVGKQGSKYLGDEIDPNGHVIGSDDWMVLLGSKDVFNEQAISRWELARLSKDSRNFSEFCEQITFEAQQIEGADARFIGILFNTGPQAQSDRGYPLSQHADTTVTPRSVVRATEQVLPRVNRRRPRPSRITVVAAAALAVALTTAAVKPAVTRLAQALKPSEQTTSQTLKPSIWMINAGDRVVVPEGLDCTTFPETEVNDQKLEHPADTAVVLHVPRGGREVVLYDSKNPNFCLQSNQIAQEDLAQTIAAVREGISAFKVQEAPEPLK